MKHTVGEIILKNGARGLLIDVPGSSVVSSSIHFRAGNRYVKNRDIYETAHIMEHMAFGANAKFTSATEYSAEFEKNGAYHNAYTSDIGMMYVADSAEIECERILELQKIAITTPKFLSKELLAESGNVQEELTGYLSNNHRLLWQRLALASGDPLMLDEDRLGTISNITLDDIREHYERTHVLNNMRFIVAGPLKGRKRQIADMFESWRLPAGDRLVIPKDEITSAAPVLIERKEVPNLIFGICMTLDERLSDAEFDAMGALNHILTGSLHSRILGTARQRGLVYHMWSDVSHGAYNSEWSFGGQVSLNNALKLFDIMVEQMNRVRAGQISAKEVEAARQYGLGKFQMAGQTVAQIADWYSGRYFFEDYIHKFNYYPRAIRAITAAKIAETAEKFINSNTWVIGGLGSPDQTLLDKLQSKWQKIFD